MSLSLPEGKILKLREKCQKTVASPNLSAREVASLLGTLESTRPAIWQAPLHFRYLQIQLIKALYRQYYDNNCLVLSCLVLHASQQNYDTILSLNSSAQAELQWWLTNVGKENSSPINPPAPDLFITSDASKAGWGAYCQAASANGRWSPHKCKEHINILKLKATFLAVKASSKISLPLRYAFEWTTQQQ